MQENQLSQKPDRNREDSLPVFAFRTNSNKKEVVIQFYDDANLTPAQNFQFHRLQSWFYGIALSHFQMGVVK